MTVEPTPAPSRRSRAYLFLCSAVTLIGAGLVWYSQTLAFAWDEGFHLLCAQLISAGRRPFVDFAFCQTPLNAYWNALWLTICGQTWRTPHAVAAVCVAGAVLLLADYLFERLPVPRWRLAVALVAAVLFGLNIAIVDFGTLGQAYGLCLLLIVAAFRFSVVGVARSSPALAAAAGLASGAAACASLLCAPVAPVLLLWMLVANCAGRRLLKVAAFIVGVAVSFLPVLALYVQSPRNVVFGILQYNLLFRAVQWDGSWRQNFEVYVSWIDSTYALLLIVLAAAGLLFVLRSDWERRLRSEFYLCGWLALLALLSARRAVPHRSGRGRILRARDPPVPSRPAALAGAGAGAPGGAHAGQIAVRQPRRFRLADVRRRRPQNRRSDAAARSAARRRTGLLPLPTPAALRHGVARFAQARVPGRPQRPTPPDARQ
jgi:hypothetical protein